MRAAKCPGCQKTVFATYLVEPEGWVCVTCLERLLAEARAKITELSEVTSEQRQALSQAEKCVREYWGFLEEARAVARRYFKTITDEDCPDPEFTAAEIAQHHWLAPEEDR